MLVTLSEVGPILVRFGLEFFIVFDPLLSGIGKGSFIKKIEFPLFQSIGLGIYGYFVAVSSHCVGTPTPVLWEVLFRIGFESLLVGFVFKQINRFVVEYFELRTAFSDFILLVGN